jgi:asparagine synthetase B (glutamine-hydrolysing)
MTVDSEAIFALAAHSGSDPHALEALHGSMAAAWLDEREPELLYAARGVGRPLWLGEARHGVFFASTKLALEVLEHYAQLRLKKHQLREGTLIACRQGEIVEQVHFDTREYVDPDPLPAVRAPEEREFCLSRLNAIAAA